MPTNPSTRFGLVAPLPSDMVSTLPTGPAATNITQFEALGVKYLSGTVSNRPAAGESGRFYIASDVAMLYFDAGFAWLPQMDFIATTKDYQGTTDPGDGWVICDGRAISRATYSILFGVIGLTRGPGDGSTTFNIPDYRGRMPIGSSGAYPPGATGGETTHTLTTNEMPYHSHNVYDPSHVHGFNSAAVPTIGGPGGYVGAGSGGYITQTGGASTGIGIYNTGGSAPHNNLPPYIAANRIIRIA